MESMAHGVTWVSARTLAPCRRYDAPCPGQGLDRGGCAVEGQRRRQLGGRARWTPEVCKRTGQGALHTLRAGRVQRVDEGAGRQRHHAVNDRRTRRQVFEVGRQQEHLVDAGLRRSRQHERGRCDADFLPVDRGRYCRLVMPITARLAAAWPPSWPDACRPSGSTCHGQLAPPMATSAAPSAMRSRSSVRSSGPRPSRMPRKPRSLSERGCMG